MARALALALAPLGIPALRGDASTTSNDFRRLPTRALAQAEEQRLLRRVPEATDESPDDPQMTPRMTPANRPNQPAIQPVKPVMTQTQPAKPANRPNQYSNIDEF